MLRPDRPRSGVRRQQRVERVGGPGHHQLVPAAEQRQGGGLQQLGGAVAERDPLGGDPVTFGQQAPDGGGVAVRVAVDEAAGARDRGVDDLGVRQVRPLGSGQVQVGQALERQALLALPARAALAVQLPLVEVLELAVVVAEAHTQLPGANVGPGPWMIRNQKVNATAATPTLIAKMRSSAPCSWRWPAARRTSFQA